MGQFKKWLMSEEIKVPVPMKRQTTSYSCGSVALQSVADYFGMQWDEKDFIRALGSDPQDGTRPSEIISLAKKLGFKVVAKENMSIKDLKQAINQHKPVICPIQAHGDEKTYRDKNINGHYVVVIGDDSEHIIIHDPSAHKQGGARGEMTIGDFIKRWHDVDADNVKYYRYGIMLWIEREPKNKSHVEKLKKVP